MSSSDREGARERRRQRKRENNSAGQVEREADREADRQTDRQTDRQADDRQIDILVLLPMSDLFFVHCDINMTQCSSSYNPALHNCMIYCTIP